MFEKPSNTGIGNFFLGLSGSFREVGLVGSADAIETFLRPAASGPAAADPFYSTDVVLVAFDPPQPILNINETENND